MTKEIYQPSEGYIIPEDKIEVIRNGNRKSIRYDIELIVPVNEDVETSQQYQCYSVVVSSGATYAEIVSTIINDKYTNDDMQAIINNHLLEADDEEHEVQYVAMQEWRTHAKEVARIALTK